MTHHAVRHLYPFAVGARQHVALRWRQLHSPQQLRLFAAHHVELPALGNLEPGNNPHAFSHGASLLPRRVDRRRAGHIRHRLPARIAADHPGHQHRQHFGAAPGGHMLREYVGGRSSVQAGDAQRQLLRPDALAVANQPAAQLGRAPVDGNIVLHGASPEACTAVFAGIACPSRSCVIISSAC